MNKPATRAMVAQLISFSRLQGLLRALMQTTAVIASAARQVGSPRSRSRAEAVNRTATMETMPPSTILPFAGKRLRAIAIFCATEKFTAEDNPQDQIRCGDGENGWHAE